MARDENNDRASSATVDIAHPSSVDSNPTAPVSNPTASGARQSVVAVRTNVIDGKQAANQMCGGPGISAFPEGDNILSWKGTITGVKDTVYEGMEYKLSLTFSNDYPFQPPKVKFDSALFHPNVDLAGNICLDILQDKWSSAYDVRSLLLSIQSLLGEPNNESPLNPQAASLWSIQHEFRKMVEKFNDAPRKNPTAGGRAGNDDDDDDDDNIGNS